MDRLDVRVVNLEHALFNHVDSTPIEDMSHALRQSILGASARKIQWAHTHCHFTQVLWVIHL